MNQEGWERGRHNSYISEISSRYNSSDEGCDEGNSDEGCDEGNSSDERNVIVILMWEKTEFTLGEIVKKAPAFVNIFHKEDRSEWPQWLLTNHQS